MSTIMDDHRSKRDPTMDTCVNVADQLEALLKQDGFKTWGFVIYRCTYQSDSDWERFMARFLSSVRESLEFYSGLDLLDTFTPTVFEDPSFEGATVATLREHFHRWKKTAMKEEQGVDEDFIPDSGRYRFFITVDQEAMESVLSAPEGADIYKSGFVRIVNAEWKWTDVPPEEDSMIEDGDDIDDPEEFEPLEGCIEHDVGWMNIRWRPIGLTGFYKLRNDNDWESFYLRYPEIADIP
jgi:hypothetical protein